MIKKVFIILFSLLLTAGSGALLGFFRDEHNKSKFNYIDIRIAYGSPDTLIDSGDIYQIVQTNFGNIIGKSIEEINLRSVESYIRKNHYVADLSLEAMLNGKLKIRINQRVPMLRLLTESSSFYIDTTGFVMPISSKYIARLPVVSGYIQPKSVIAPGTKIFLKESANSKEEPNRLLHCFLVAKYVFGNESLFPLIDQFYVNEQGELELISKFGNHTILFGKADNIEEKFNKLLAFYKQGIPKYGWTAFGHLNLKYSNQVVCSKN